MAAQLLPTAYTTKTYRDSGADYSSMAAWWAARCEGINMVTATSGEVLSCLTKSDSGAYNDYCVMGSCTSSEQYFPAIIAADGHYGTPTSGVRISLSGSAAGGLVGFYAIAYATFGYLYASVVNSGGSAFAFFAQNVTGAKFVGCNTGCVQASDGFATGFYTGNSATDVARICYIIVCAATGVTGTTEGAGGIRAFSNTKGFTLYLYNTTINSNTRGLVIQDYGSGILTINSKNCIIQNNTTQIVSSGTPVHNQTTNQTSGVTFAADGYHLGAATNNGTDLSADATWSVTTDIDGDTYKSTPSIGCDQWNTAPDAPSNPVPADTATGVAAGDVTLSCDVTDDDGDAMTVTFYDASDDSLIGTDAAVASGGTATVTWAGRAAGTLYTWYAKANDGALITTGPDWTFTTASGNNIFNFNMDLGISL